MTKARIVVLTRHERKDRLGHGGVKAVAEALRVDAALVSRVLNGKKRHARVEAEIARRILGQGRNELAFPPREEPEKEPRAQQKAS